jgi:hypothetical protein
MMLYATCDVAGDKLYKKPEMLVGFYLTPKDGPGLRKFMAAVRTGSPHRLWPVAGLPVRP